MWVKGTLVLIFALFIDGLQALIGLGISTIALVPGTVAGTAAGCAAGQQVAGSVGCAIGGFVLGALGSIPFINGALATVTIPLGIILIFAINVCISITMGAGLIATLWILGMFYPVYVTGVFIGEAMPGLDVVPGWTFLAIRSIMKKSAESGVNITALASGVASAVLSPSGATSGLGSVARGISNIKNETGATARSSPLVSKAYNSESSQHIAGERTQLASDVGREIAPRPNNPRSTNTLHAKIA